MDPVSLIVTALTAGAVAGAQNTATDAVKDAYAGLKELVHRRFKGRPSGETALEQHEIRPHAWQGALEAELVEVDAGRDGALIDAAEQLIALTDTQPGRYRVYVRESQNVQIGDYNTQTNTNNALSKRL